MEISILGAFLPFTQSLRHKGDYMQKDYILGSLISISPPRFNSTNHIYILISTVVCKSSARCNLSLSMITIVAGAVNTGDVWYYSPVFGSLL